MLRRIGLLMMSGLVLACLSAGLAKAQQGEARVALVIGNSSYQAGALATAANDAGLVAQTLQAAGFDVVGARDLDQDSLRRAFRDFLQKAQQSGPNTVAFIYMSGYGLQLEGENYFVPIDARIASDTDVAAEALRVSDFTRPLAALRLKATIVVMDAARQNPFAASGRRLAGGLALVEPEPGVLIAFNSAPGTVAPEGRGSYGPYAQALSEMMRDGGLPLPEMFGRVRLRVNDVTKGAEVPWHASKVTTQFVFFERAPDAPPLAVSTEHTTSIRSRPIREFDERDAYIAALERDTLNGYLDFLGAYPQSEFAKRIRAIVAARREAIVWQRTRSIDTPPAYWSYLRRYPRGPHAGDAHRRLAYLAAALEPPRAFAMVEYDVPPPPPEEIVYIERPVLVFSDPLFAFAPPPPPPVFFLPPPPPDFVVLPPPPQPVGLFLLPTPVYRPVPLWVRPPAYVAPPPPNNVIYNNVHNTVVINNTTSSVTITNPSGQTSTMTSAAAVSAAAAATPAAARQQSGQASTAPVTSIGPALPPSVAQKAAITPPQSPQGSAASPGAPAQTTPTGRALPGVSPPSGAGSPAAAPPAGTASRTSPASPGAAAPNPAVAPSTVTPNTTPPAQGASPGPAGSRPPAAAGVPPGGGAPRATAPTAAAPSAGAPSAAAPSAAAPSAAAPSAGAPGAAPGLAATPGGAGRPSVAAPSTTTPAPAPAPGTGRPPDGAAPGIANRTPPAPANSAAPPPVNPPAPGAGPAPGRPPAAASPPSPPPTASRPPSPPPSPPPAASRPPSPPPSAVARPTPAPPPAPMAAPPPRPPAPPPQAVARPPAPPPPAPPKPAAAPAPAPAPAAAAKPPACPAGKTLQNGVCK